MMRRTLLLLPLLVTGVCRADDAAPLDWNALQRMPAFGAGRIVPLDTFARETAEAICGRADPVLALGDAPPRKFNANELLLSWLAEPERWDAADFLKADDPALRRDVLALPLFDSQGRRLRYASPAYVENSAELGRRYAELQQRAAAEGKSFRLTRLDKKIKTLVDAYGAFRALTYDPRAPKDAPRRFFARVHSAAKAWRQLAGTLAVSEGINRDAQLRQEMVASGDALQKMIAEMHGSDFDLRKVEPLVTAFAHAVEPSAARLAKSDDRPIAAMAADLRRQTEQLQLALYDNGETLRLVPALDCAALEEDRSPDDDASPWLSFQAMIYGSDALTAAYPQPELKSVREAWARLKAAYLDKKSADRSARFNDAAIDFAHAVLMLGRRIEPLRERLPLESRDDDVLRATAYPPSGSTSAEVFYNRLNPFFWAWMVSLAATIFLLSAVGRFRRPMFWIGVAVLLAAEAFTTAGLGLRGYITGLVPLTGMFETVVFVALYAALLGLWFGLKPLAVSKRSSRSARGNGGELKDRARCEVYGDGKHNPHTECEEYNGASQAHTECEEYLRRRPFVLAGAVVSFVAMVLAYYAPATVMHRNIGSVAPILRDNFWLAVHVVTIMASYASAAIALILGDIALGYYLFGRYEKERPPEACRLLARFTYTAIQITILLLAAGTILGALWADKAWGRFWGWDPKEVWALISLLVYLAIVHARHVGWAGDFGMALAAVLGATAVLFTWYGVNFLLGSGLHSYGAGAGGQWQVGCAMAAQWLFLLAAAVRYIVKTGVPSEVPPDDRTAAR